MWAGGVWSGVVFWLVVSLLMGGLSARGEYGAMSGAVNALFSVFAFAGLIIAILLQRQELQLQRQELAATRQELAQSASAQWQLVNSQRVAALMNARATLMQRYATGLPTGQPLEIQEKFHYHFSRLEESVEALEVLAEQTPC